MSRYDMKKFIPFRIREYLNRLINIFNTLLNYAYDFKRYLRYSGVIRPFCTVEKLSARIMAHYHSIERGLSLPDVKKGFGRPLIDSLFKLLSEYRAKGYDVENHVYRNAISILYAYIDHHEKIDHNVGELKSRIRSISNANIKCGGVEKLCRSDILESTKDNFELFSAKRYSIRDFSDEDVDISIIKKAVKIAQKTPSVCNRQTARVYVIETKSILNEVLCLHNGVRGFSGKINKIVILTSDLEYFFDSRERNQCFVDGGLFFMSLIYSLHYLGLGTCPLNWCVNKDEDTKLRKACNIKQSENIIGLIAVGHLPDRFHVACSVRRELDDIVNVL